jgi:hypothetical protein
MARYQGASAPGLFLGEWPIFEEQALQGLTD